MNKRLTEFFITGISFIFFAFFLAACSGKSVESKKVKSKISVITGKVAIQNVKYILNQVGSLEATQRVTLRSEIEGRVIEIFFKEGEITKQGDVLVKLDPAKIQAEISRLKAKIYEQNVRLENKKRTFERNRQLVDQELVSKQDFDDIETEIKEIKASIKQSEADLLRQEVFLSDTIIKAPFNGFVGDRKFSRGHYLKKGDPVLSIVDINCLEIQFKVPEKYRPKIDISQKVSLKVDPYPERVFVGIIFFISPEIDVITRSFYVKAKVENSDHVLFPGMFALVKVVTDIHNNAAVVPWESIIQKEDETYIYVVENDIAFKKKISLGKVTDKWAEIITPKLHKEDIVICEGKYAVTDNIKIFIKSTKQKTW